MFKILAFLAKRPELTTAELTDYYENHHVPLICSLGAPPPTYRRNYLQRDQPLLPNDAIAFDVVTEQAFDDRAAFDAWLATMNAPGNRERVREDEARFLDHSRYFAYVVEEHSGPRAIQGGPLMLPKRTM